MQKGKAMKINYMISNYTWRGDTISLWQLSKSGYADYWQLRKANVINHQFPLVLCQKTNGGHFVFVPPEWGGDELEFKIAIEQYANTPGIMKIA